MPRSRGSEMPQKQSPRTPLHLRTTACSDSNGAHRSPRLDDRRSPRSPLHEVQKKRGTRVSDLETKLGHAQEELKKLKEQLVHAEAAKRDAQQELEHTKKLIPIPTIVPQDPEEDEELLPSDPPEKTEPSDEEQATPVPESETIEENTISDSPATDVFEAVTPTDAIPVESLKLQEQADSELKTDKVEEENEEKEDERMKVVIEEAGKEERKADQEEQDGKAMDSSSTPHVTEISAQLSEWDKKLARLIAENESLKKQAVEAEQAKAKEKELIMKLTCMENELKESKANAEQLKEHLNAVEKTQATLETEMRRLKVQTDQWRKAAETAAAVLTGGGEMGAETTVGRAAERCGSMDKHHGYDLGSRGFVGLGSPLMSEEDDGFSGGKRRGGGIRMFGDLWKKKGHQ